MNRSAAPAGWQRPGPLRVTLLVALLCLIWGSTWLVIREGLHDLPPFSSAAARFLLAAAVMWGVAGVLARREGGARPPRWLAVVMGTLNFAVSYGVVYQVERTLPSGLTCVLWGVFPLVMAVCSHFGLPGERLRPRHAVGFVSGFAGVVLLFLTDVAAVGPGATPVALLLLVSPLVVAVATVLIKRHGSGVSSLLLNRDGLAIGAVLLAAAALLFERDAEFHLTGRAVFTVVYLALPGTVLTFGIYFWLLRHAPAYKLSVIPYVTPAVALVLGHVAGGEPAGGTTVGGLALILGGVLLVTGLPSLRRGSSR